ncbi:MAG TPA: GntR family transcriptional regulator [Planctomycetes bacterium]|nr:GntR family transcriptional regulator [Fuerstiella sp.]HIK93622.1 GntR family transcriptional regulator [Planctomycetota bacterium]
MQIRISQDDGTPIYQQVVSQVKLLVSSGRLDQGEQLPAVRKLAEQLLINPNTVARAYRELESAGVVVSRRGSGVFVSDAGSPLSRREKNRILNDRIDALLAESVQLDFDLENVVTLVRQRGSRFRKGEKK